MRALCLVVVLAACGDNTTCKPTPPELPSGALNDPYAVIGDGCLEDGLSEIGGRWFVADGTQLFSFAYPAFAGTCSDGFRRTGAPPEDHDLKSDGETFYTWSDGTVYYERTEYATYPQSTVFGTAYCVTHRGQLVSVHARSDRTGVTSSTWNGRPFERKDVVASGLSLVSEQLNDVNGKPMQALDLKLDGGYAYVVGELGMDIFDVTDPAAPRAISHLDGSYNDVVIIHGDGETVAWVAPFSGDHTLVVKVTDPRVPSIAVELPDYSHTIKHAGSFVYLATYTNDIPLFDVTHPLAPTRAGSTIVPGPDAGVHDLWVDGNVIYANNTTAGFVAFDVSAGLAHPVQLGHVATSYSHSSLAGIAGGRQVVIHGDEGMTASPDGAAFIRILDGDRTSAGYLSELARYKTRPEVGSHNFQLVGDRLYLSYYQDGIRVVDLSDPTKPKEVAHYNTWDATHAAGADFEGAVGIAVQDGLIYVADLERGLVILHDDQVK